MAAAVMSNPDLRPHVGRATEDLNPLRCLAILERIPHEDCDLLDLDPDVGRPERLILRRLLVPPACIRPSVAMDASGGSNEDDLTMKRSEICFIHQVIRKSLEGGANVQVLRTGTFCSCSARCT